MRDLWSGWKVKQEKNACVGITLNKVSDHLLPFDPVCFINPQTKAMKFEDMEIWYRL